MAKQLFFGIIGRLDVSFACWCDLRKETRIRDDPHFLYYLHGKL